MTPSASRSHLPSTVRIAGLCAVFWLLSITARAALVVNTNLGTLGFGSLSLLGTTVGGPNNANRYTNSGASLFWGSEYVYQFTISTRAAVSLTSTDPNGAIDNDFFLLGSLATTLSGGVNTATALGSLVEVSGDFGVLDPGTYYLVVDAYAATNSAAAGNTGAFNAALTIAPIVIPPFISAIPGGSITVTLGAQQILWYQFNHTGGALTLDTIGSTLGPDNDTELFLFDANGSLLAANDDIAAGNYLSRITIASLAAGTFYLAAGGYDMTGAAGYSVSSTSVEAGQMIIRGISLAPSAPPQLAAVSLVGNVQTFRLSGTQGRTYTIERSANLQPASWTADGAPVTLSTPEQTFTRTLGAQDRRVFYRATEQP